MSVKLTNISPKIISLSEMKDGQIAEIVDWDSFIYIGTIVQKWNNHLIAIGKTSGNSWSNIFNSGSDSVIRCKVRPLEPGEKIEIVNN